MNGLMNRSASPADEELALVIDRAEAEWKSKKQRKLLHVFSGGASGADFEWCSVALQCSAADVVIMSFPGHARHTPAGCTVQELSEVVLRATDKELNIVAKNLKRKLPAPGYTLNLLRRNIHIVKDAEAVYAIGELSDSGAISGGTAWGCEYHKTFCFSPNLFFFDMKQERWLSYAKPGRWIPKSPPSPSKFTTCALIGSRELSVEGREAIHDILNQ